MDLTTIITDGAAVFAASVTICGAMATKLPPPPSDARGAYPAFYAVVNAIALNFGHARNASQPAAPEIIPVISH